MDSLGYKFILFISHHQQISTSPFLRLHIRILYISNCKKKHPGGGIYHCIIPSQFHLTHFLESQGVSLSRRRALSFYLTLTQPSDYYTLTFTCITLVQGK
jgi:hypothetical protein